MFNARLKDILNSLNLDDMMKNQQLATFVFKKSRHLEISHIALIVILLEKDITFASIVFLI